MRESIYSSGGGSSDSSIIQDECVALADKVLRPPLTKIRTLQDLLKDRAVFVVDSADKFDIRWHPPQAYVKPLRKAKTIIAEFDDEDGHEARRRGVFGFLHKLWRRGRREVDVEDAENIKTAEMDVTVSKKPKDAASATLNDSTINVLEAAHRKRLINQYLAAHQQQLLQQP